MENFRIVILIFGSLSILFGYLRFITDDKVGYLRFITDDKGNVELNNYRFTGGLGYVIGGLIDGTRDIFSRHLTSIAISTSALYFGILLFYIGFKM